MSRSDYLREVRSKIDQFGWALQGVFPAPGERGPGFTYTVGLTNFGHPEIVTFGLPQQTAAVILNDLGRRVQAGEQFAAGQQLDDLGNYPMRLVAVADVRKHFGIARQVFTRITALQLVWPDKAGVFPWEPGYAIDRDTQPLLGVWPL